MMHPCRIIGTVEEREQIRVNVHYTFLKGDKGDPGYTPQRGVDYWTEGDKAEILAEVLSMLPWNRVTSLDSTALTGQAIEAVGNPVYVSDITRHADYGITETGWYVFANIKAPQGVTVRDGFSIIGAAGNIVTAGRNSIDVAVRFETAAMSQTVVINWDGEKIETFVFKGTDLAVRNLDYRVTFYIYDIDDYATWEFELTADAQFKADTYYYILDGDKYVPAEVTVGETVPENTYYVHSKVTFEGMTRNITYRCNTVIDCPVIFILPGIEDDTHGCWFEIRFRHSGSFSSTLVPPSADVKVATEHTQAETKGLNMVDLHYSDVCGAKVWRFMNTHSNFTA